MSTITEWDRKFPKPDRSGHMPQQDAHREFNPEIDLAAGEFVMNDGRPAVVEDWYDRDCEVFCRTVFYSALGTDTWSEADHYSFLEANGLLKGKTYPDRGVALTENPDTSGEKFWGANVVMRRD